MNPQLPLTRRDIIALFVYVLIAAPVFIGLLQLVGSKVLPYFPLFASRFSPPSLVVNLLPMVLLLLLPLVPIITAGVAGRYADQTVTRRGIRSLLFPCAGLAMCAISLPGLLATVYYAYSFRTSTSSGASYSYPLIYVANYLIAFSVGFAFAFFPAIFDSLRARIRDEEGV